MAASGIQEHNEARRKERVLMKKANWQKNLNTEQAAYGMVGAANMSCNSITSDSYEAELLSRRVGSPPGIDSSYDAKAVDRRRRQEHYNQQQSEYSAKINGRYRNFDYLSQW